MIPAERRIPAIYDGPKDDVPPGVLRRLPGMPSPRIPGQPMINTSVVGRKYVRTCLRVVCVTVVGSRRLLTETPPAPGGVEQGEAMRFRGKSIRRKIVALLLVPLVSLDRPLGLRHRTDRSGGQPASRRHFRCGRSRLSGRGHRRRHPERTPPDAHLPCGPPRFRRAAHSASRARGHRQGHRQDQSEYGEARSPRRHALRQLA